MRLTALALATLLLSTPALSEAVRFDVTLSGLRAAVLTVEAEEGGGRYAARVRVTTTGAAAVLRPVRFAAEAAGRLSGNRPRPERYAESVDTGRRQSSARLAWQDGIPAAADGSGSSGPKGAVDPASALFAGLRDRTEPCKLSFAVFDGTRLAQVDLSPAAAADGETVCKGRFSRQSGYPPEDLARRRHFDFTARFAALPDGRWRLQELETDTAFGRALLRRR